MSLHRALRELATARGDEVFDDPDALRSALGDTLRGGDTADGEVDLLVDAASHGALGRLRTSLGDGAPPAEAVAATARSYAGEGDRSRAEWAVGSIGYAVGVLEQAPEHAPAGERRSRGVMAAIVPPRGSGVSYRRAYTLLLIVGLTMAVLTFWVHKTYGRPILDPEGSFLGPSYVRLPVLLAVALGVDLLPRTLWLSRGKPTELGPLVKERWRTHWTGERMVLVFVGVAAFYVTYVGYRNLKSYLPYVRRRADGGALLYDNDLHKLDRVLFFGHNPGEVLQAVLGTHGPVPYLLSWVYLFFLPLVPVVVCLWVVWSRNISFGYWFVNAQCLAWSLGTLSYYLLPTLGPGIMFKSEYGNLPNTSANQLMDSIVNSRFNLLWGGDRETVNSIAGFASLHTCITLLVALMVHYTIRTRWLRIACWIYFGLVVVATLYFGWHYVADDIAGAAIAIFSVWLGGVASGQKFDPGMRSHPTTTTSRIPVERG
ncbi:MAG: phosphatase PAP2 family protein [Nocardioidaceae bacterium]|nr:phosphatase PAP2 family protein [Nocardioidaceae bacterium]MCL2614095.1 phosphatase PAP2 family protein [Nocardioidaceae bacterium]